MRKKAGLPGIRAGLPRAGADLARARPGRVLQRVSSSSTSNLSVALGGITPPAPRAP